MPGRDDPLGDIEQFVEQFTGSLSAEIAVDVLESDDEVVVLADLPGRDPADVEVHLEDDSALHIEAPAPEEDSDGEYVLQGRTRGTVSRTVRLPAVVDDSQTDAEYDRGVLTIRLGKPDGGDGTEIPVT